MCGVAAIFAYHPAASAVDRIECRFIRDAMAVRGPDGSGEWFSPDGRVGMGHRRLAIVDLSDQGAQPMTNRGGTIRLVFNGEIYNYQSLRAELIERGHVFESSSDAEVLIHLYEDKGIAMLNDLRGMFAFALWDDKQGGMWLARDPFGIKPLYYADDGKTLRAASQVKALLQSPHIDTTPEAAGHVGFFLWGYVPEPRTLYQGIQALPAGDALWVDVSGQRRQTTYCNISAILAQAGTNRCELSETERQDYLREALLDSVRHHMIADVPVGIFLSAGLDSTTLTALATEVVPERLHTTTLGFKAYEGTDDDEVPLAEHVAQYYATAHRTVSISHDEFALERDDIFQAMDQPTTDGVNGYFVSKVAASSGLKVSISGVGGDELFGTYPSFQQIPHLVNRLSLLPGLSFWGRGLRVVSAPFLKHITSPKYAGLFEYGGRFNSAYLLRRSLFMPWELPAFMDGDLVRQGWETLQPLLNLERTLQDIQTDHLKISALELTWYMRGQLLRDADWAGMAHSLEIRTPLVDVDLLRRLAPLWGGEILPTKRNMACSPSHPLPQAVMERQKTGFVVPIHTWLAAESEPYHRERGLRGWAKQVYAAHCHER